MCEGCGQCSQYLRWGSSSETRVRVHRVGGLEWGRQEEGKKEGSGSGPG